MDEQESKATAGTSPVPEALLQLDLDPRDASLVLWLAGCESSEAEAGTGAGAARCTLLDRDDALWTGGDDSPPPLALRMSVPLHAVVLANVACDFAGPSSVSLPTADEGARFKKLQIAYRHALMERGGTEGVEKKVTTTTTETSACQSPPSVPPLLHLSPRMILEHDSRRMELKRRCQDHLDLLAREAERELLNGVEDESRRAEGRARRTREARRRRKQREKMKRRAGVEATEEATARRRPGDDIALSNNGDGDDGSTRTREAEEKAESEVKGDEDPISASADTTEEDIVGSEPSHEGNVVDSPLIKPSQSKETSGQEGSSREPDNAEEAAVVDENTSPNERDDEASSSSSSKTRPPAKPNRASYLDAVKSSRGRASAPPSGVPPNSSPHPPPSPLTPSASAQSSDSSSSSSTTTSPDEEDEAVVVDRLERRLESQRREHVEMIQQVQLKAFIAETKATAAVDRTRELERKLLDATYPEVAAAAAASGGSSPTKPRPTGTRSTREDLELRLRSQRRDHLAMMRRVQLRTYLAETKARAAEERSVQLEDLLAREGGGLDRDDDEVTPPRSEKASPSR